MAAPRRATTRPKGGRQGAFEPQAALDQARGQAAQSAALEAQARARLAAMFPDLPLPDFPPDLGSPELPEQSLEALRDMVVSRSHEIVAAEREATHRALSLAEIVDVPIVIVHVSNREAMEEIRRARQRGPRRGRGEAGGSGGVQRRPAGGHVHRLGLHQPQEDQALSKSLL